MDGPFGVTNPSDFESTMETFMFFAMSMGFVQALFQLIIGLTLLYVARYRDTEAIQKRRVLIYLMGGFCILGAIWSAAQLAVMEPPF
ncbi:hypothetical protein PPSIR1_25616 [Plesiocystis pacifica SIR-1]|uniref:Uncharacterized protein n=1 Tax=Plesiocystis pacifica SIR-1 TaxID=391625 RepID=A6FZD7_9BACT|nr:hypothetical protein [Plesiocystis pacifica]EDM81021.1 hypothetical protein PPSIR1_25616 [Plesiocystis pacifica SIR-1]